MSSGPSSYSAKAMSRFQFLMLRAVEAGASLAKATDEALAWGARHPDSDLFEQRAYAAWESDGHDEEDHDAGVEAESAPAYWT
jgi:hypothetical protein